MLASLAGQATRVVVPTEVARVRLETEAERPLQVEVIPHGSAFLPMAPRPEPRRQILTWGFVGPGMGAERVIRALAQLHDMHPPPEFRLIGVTDPVWNRGEAEAYRSELMEEAERLGVADQVEIVPVLHSSDELASQIEECDLLVVAYDDTSRSASRILSEAISTGRPVIATAFPGAVEMLASGAGSTVAHDSDDELQQALRRYLTDDDSYQSAARTASSMSSDLGWDETAGKLADLILGLVDATALVDENKH